ncbi:uncharacterized protein SPAPADRAFT_52339 [Spathaspora passalidarum NRRL Y-27907]|uniref:Nonsense-mediated mRNA decay factor n=1 Tax=Spathaspora passalidarum (strain NRRL Y-27907 / 11-Y1) TaxID=619300 RepID=G3AT11_SPAPN|nr:uncharacterized protein SPAPADRAFT_52339 [Spathaspora passalidarum NRRL Y-27907]EGW31171.1 hypothetical protein SPAPADRAFT_52339 [Spathaspora passalidarum NRRL Y-27907]
MAQADEILAYKNQLNEFLTRKFPDLSLLIGFNTLLQSKFQSWIIADLNEYYSLMERGQSETVEFNTMKYLETIWNEFHYPTIKFFQHQHQALFQEIQESFKTCQVEGTANQFKVKPVEMRKVNDNFIKFIKQVFEFCVKLLKYFTTKFSNSFIPREFLAHFNLSVSESAAICKDNNFQANVLYLIHRCVLSLGDICRHQTFVELTYVQPATSNKDFFKFRSLANSDKTQAFFPKYRKAIQYYKYCIMLLPALNEPYNHIGMIHNLVDDKYQAIYWFLRSQFTRIPEYKLGLSNLNNVLKKHWFITALVDVVNNNKERQFKIDDSLNIYLVCLMGYFYYPQQYKNGPNLVKKLSFSKIESEFFKSLSSNFSSLIQVGVREENFILTQLTVLFSFTELCKQKSDDVDVHDKVVRFTFRYIEKIFDCLKQLDFEKIKLTNICIILRFILNWLKENKSMYLTFESRKQSVLGICNILNRFIEYNTDKEHMKLMLTQSNRPTRSYYFWEDVHFRDFKLIKYQFKDFKDDALFQVNNINFLIGDYSELLHDKVPTFLSEDKQKLFAGNPKEVEGEIEKYENGLRIHALVSLGKRLLFACKSFDVSLDETSLRFLVKESQEKKSREMKEKKKETNKQTDDKPKDTLKVQEQKPCPVKKHKKSSQTPTPTPEPQTQTTDELSGPPVKVPVSLEEIESFIAKHTHELKSGISAQEGNSEDAQEPELQLHNMVDSLVDDDSKEVINISTGTLNSSTQNIWKHEPAKDIQPKFFNSLAQPIGTQVHQYPANFSQYLYPQMQFMPSQQSIPQSQLQFPYHSTPMGQLQSPTPPVFASYPQSQPTPQQPQGFPQAQAQPMFGTFPIGPESQKSKSPQNNETGNINNGAYSQYFSN